MVDVECDDCPYTVRVTAGELDGAHESILACESCAPVYEADLRRRWDKVEIVPIGRR